jgi:hypothetical protein
VLKERYGSMGIKLIAAGIDGNKWPFKVIDMPRFRQALAFVLAPENRPCLIHCNKGKHRTGSLIASLRLVRGWALSSVFAEYITFSGARQRLEDQIFIEIFYKHLVRTGDIQCLLQEEADAIEMAKLSEAAEAGVGETSALLPSAAPS